MNKYQLFNGCNTNLLSSSFKMYYLIGPKSRRHCNTVPQAEYAPSTPSDFRNQFLQWRNYQRLSHSGMQLELVENYSGTLEMVLSIFLSISLWAERLKDLHFLVKNIIDLY